MKKKILLSGLIPPGLIIPTIVVVFSLSACTGRDGTAAGEKKAPPGSVMTARNGASAPAVAPDGTGRILVNDAREMRGSPQDTENIPRLLQEIAELERAGAYQQGMGLIESGLREKSGDYAGAVLAAVKEMARSYGYGEIPLEDLLQGLDRAAYLEDMDGKETVVQTALALRSFFEGRWSEAEKKLTEIFPEPEDPDDYASWLLLSCALEKSRDGGEGPGRKSASAYRAIRARYMQFPEYWYRGARVFSDHIASEFAERCINLAPEGPFAPECRSILALHAGLKPENGSSILSKQEIENCISKAVISENPDTLAPLIPLISLPENPYTLYAIGALKSLSAVPLYRGYFDALAVGSKGRLADRLVYLCRD